MHIYIKRQKKSHCWSPGNKGSRDNGGEADKSRRPQETGQITMPAECADQLGNTAKKEKKEKRNSERHCSVKGIATIGAPPAYWGSGQSHLSARSPAPQTSVTRVSKAATGNAGKAGTSRRVPLHPCCGFCWISSPCKRRNKDGCKLEGCGLMDRSYQSNYLSGLKSFKFIAEQILLYFMDYK